ncbi:hypothetical protein cypCar_00022964, partial [Cyprinus carpio]
LAEQIFKAPRSLMSCTSQLNWISMTLEDGCAGISHTRMKTPWPSSSTQARRKQDSNHVCLFNQELTLNIEKLTLEANQKRKVLDSEVTETVTAQVIDVFLAPSHFSIMQAEVNQVIREKNYLLKERKDFMEREIENNKELERNISAAERQVLRLRQQLQEEERNQRRLQDEVEVLKGTLDRIATDVETNRYQLTSMKKDIQDKTAKVKEATLHNAALKEKLGMVTEVVLDGEEQAAQMEQLRREQEQSIKEIDAQLLRQRELMFRKSQELQGLLDKEKNTTAEICATRAAISNLEGRLSKLDQNLLKRQMIISNQARVPCLCQCQQRVII